MPSLREKIEEILRRYYGHGDRSESVDCIMSAIASEYAPREVSVGRKRSSLPRLPEIPEAVLEKHNQRPYDGPIEPGMIFAWEPKIPTARQLCMVTRVTSGEDPMVWTSRFPDGQEEYYNEVGRFREAVVRTKFR